MAATLQRKSSCEIIYVIITKIFTKEIVTRNYFVILSARMVHRVSLLWRSLFSAAGSFGQFLTGRGHSRALPEIRKIRAPIKIKSALPPQKKKPKYPPP